MGKVEKRIDRDRQHGGVWQIFVAAMIAWLFVSPFPFHHSPGFPRTYAAGIDSAAVSTATPEGRLAVFDDVWQTVYDRYYDAKFHGIDWWAQRAELRSLAADARDPGELYAVLRRLLTSLRDAHTRVYAPDQKFDWQHPRFITIGLSLREIQGQLTVLAVERGSDAEHCGIRAGDVVEKINGESALFILERKLRQQAGSSTPQAARLFALASLTDGPPGTSLAIEWTGNNNKLRQASLLRRWQERTPGLRIKHHHGIAVITIDAFTHVLALEFARATNDRLMRMRGIVIDLRNNGGGDAQAMAEIASAFLPVATSLGEFTDRHGNVSLKIETGAMPPFSPYRNKPIQVPMAVLTSERTSSAAEIFIAALKQTNRATVFGVQTCGCVLAVRMRHALPDDGELEVSELDYHTAGGIRLEGAGIKPDEFISLTRRDVYGGRDLVLESAFLSLRAYPRP
jgi:carboxyl-terminal processing protease